jgi:hypothetical protein
VEPSKKKLTNLLAATWDALKKASSVFAPICGVKTTLG